MAPSLVLPAAARTPVEATGRPLPSSILPSALSSAVGSLVDALSDVAAPLSTDDRRVPPTVITILLWGDRRAGVPSLKRVVTLGWPFARARGRQCLVLRRFAVA